MKIKWLITITLVTIWILPINGNADPIKKDSYSFFDTKKGELNIKKTIKGKKIPLNIKLEDNPKKVKGPTGLKKKGLNTKIKLMTGLPATGTGEIDIELVALSLVSVAPVKLGSSATPSLFDVFVSLYPTIPNLPAKAEGKLTVSEHDDAGKNGGTALFSIPLLPLQVDFVPVPGNNGSRVEERIDVKNLRSDTFSWSHTPTKFYPTIPNLPAGDFYPQDPLQITDGTNGVFSLSLAPATIPEAGTLVLLGTGLLLLGIGRRRGKAG